jgi:hypothetical protein
MSLCLKKARALSIFSRGLRSAIDLLNTADFQKKRVSTDRGMTKAVPLKVLKSGRLHMYFDDLSKNQGSVTRLTVLRRNIVVLNTPEVVHELFSLKQTDGRPSPFFQQYVFLDKGFSFSDLTTSAIQQKNVLMRCLEYEILHFQSDSAQADIQHLTNRLLESGSNTSVDIHVKSFLSNVFSRLVSLNSLFI